ncbi:MAG: hypothetical protein PUC12_00185, partial [Clostridiales bacterium]|nr:hypothetical protein [Clostridiales bacterium]
YNWWTKDETVEKLREELSIFKKAKLDELSKDVCIAKGQRNCVILNEIFNKICKHAELCARFCRYRGS